MASVPDKCRSQSGYEAESILTLSRWLLPLISSSVKWEWVETPSRATVSLMSKMNIVCPLDSECQS